MNSVNWQFKREFFLSSKLKDYFITDTSLLKMSAFKSTNVTTKMNSTIVLFIYRHWVDEHKWRSDQDWNGKFSSILKFKLKNFQIRPTMRSSIESRRCGQNCRRISWKYGRNDNSLPYNCWKGSSILKFPKFQTLALHLGRLANRKLSCPNKLCLHGHRGWRSHRPRWTSSSKFNNATTIW